MSPQPNAVSAIVAEIRVLCNEVGVDDETRTGPEATYPNSLIITILILKSLFGFDSERSFLRFLVLHHHGVFPRLPEHSWFNRKARKLGKEQADIHGRLQKKLGTALDETEIINTTPAPVVKLHRAYRCRSFKRKTEVNFGYCASKKEYYYGKKLSLFVTEQGIPTGYGLSVANQHDLPALKALLPEYGERLRHKTLLADKGYYDGELLLVNSRSVLVPGWWRRTKGGIGNGIPARTDSYSRKEAS